MNNNNNKYDKDTLKLYIQLTIFFKDVFKIVFWGTIIGLLWNVLATRHGWIEFSWLETMAILAILKMASLIMFRSYEDIRVEIRQKDKENEKI